MDILFQADVEINPQGLSLRQAEPSQRDAIDKKYPELAQRVLETGRGRYGEASREWAEIDADYYSAEAWFEDRLFKPSADEDSITKIEFRRYIDELDGLRLAQKHLVRIDHGLFLEDRDLPEDPNDRALAEYYRLVASAIERPPGLDETSPFTGVFDGEVFALGLDALESMWTPEQKDFVDRNTGLAVHTPFVKKFNDDKRMLVERYWSITDRHMEAEEVKDVYDRWRRMDSLEQAEFLLLPENNRLKVALQTAASLRAAVRGDKEEGGEQNPLFDAEVQRALLDWDYITNPPSFEAEFRILEEFERVPLEQR